MSICITSFTLKILYILYDYSFCLKIYKLRLIIYLFILHPILINCKICVGQTNRSERINIYFKKIFIFYFNNFMYII